MTNHSFSYKRKPDALIQREIDGEYVIMNTITGHIHQLNPVASYIWSQLEDATSLEELAEKIAAEFSVEPGNALHDAEHFISELSRLGLVEKAGPLHGPGP